MPLATGAEGVHLENAAPIHVTWRYGDATPIDSPFYVAPRAMRITKIVGRSLVAGGGGACTGVIKKAPSATAVASGTAVMSGSIDLTTTADANFAAISLSATAAALSLAAGDCLGLDVTGTATSAVGVITVEMVPLT
jgi:hypothetical protein